MLGLGSVDTTLNLYFLYFIYIYYTYLILRHSLADLELVTWARLALDSQRSTHLCFRSAGTKVCVTMPGWASFIRRQQCYCLLESKSSFGENGNHSSNSRTMFLYDFLQWTQLLESRATSLFFSYHPRKLNFIQAVMCASPGNESKSMF